MQDVEALIARVNEMLLNKVKQAKEDFDIYSLEVPKLQQQRAGLEEELEELNAEYVKVTGDISDAEDELSSLRATITKEQELHKKEIAKAQLLMEKEREGMEAVFAESTKAYQERDQLLNSREDDIDREAGAVARSRKQLEDDLTDFKKREEALTGKEEAIETLRSETSLLKDTAASQKAELDRREADIAKKEEAAKEALKEAQSIKAEADRIAYKAHNDMLIVEAKENEVVKREVAVQTQGEELRKKQIALNDRMQVMQSHG